jgi:hypothetical protein
MPGKLDFAQLKSNQIKNNIFSMAISAQHKLVQVTILLHTFAYMD